MKTKFNSFLSEARKYKVQFPITTGSGVKFGDVNKEVELKKFAIVGEIFGLDSVSGHIDKDHYELDFGRSMVGGMAPIITTWGDREMKVVGRNFFKDIYQGTDKWHCSAIIGDPDDDDARDEKFSFDYCPTISKKKSDKNDPYDEEDWGDNCDFKQFRINIEELKKAYDKK